MIDIEKVIPNIRNRYHATKSDAKRRGIEWQFTFESWLDWWGSDIVNRGPGPGQLVMARTGDIGPYHPSNVRKATTAENQNEAHLGKKRTPEQVERNRLSHLGLKPSEATRQALSKALKGKPKTEEHKKNVSIAIIEWHKQRKIDKELS